MFIKSVIIDGFKSYGTRTEINGFDPEFNAITGLNGTGKSNILDSICFVLGISNLTHVRANSMQDLIYKSGQAGVTKATVTIVFDNRDKHRSPINYEQYDEITVSRQIIVAGKTRFMINGVSVNNKALTDFFSSVQLNVNNPHFLIMQGRITKVLNMKPPEILSMIEEAAGTRMYENKKIGAQKTIEKKDCKLKEMDDMVAESITPKLQKLKEEKTMYVEYMRIQKELEQLTRVYKAYQYLNLETALEGMNYEEGLKERLVDQIRNLEDSLRTASGRLDDLVHRNARLIFEYSDPEPNFDRRKVRGLVCKLFQMKDQKFSRAVETTAEGRLFNVVVDDESISAKLIKKGNLRWRTTFAPLNRVRGHQLDQRIIRKADEVLKKMKKEYRWIEQERQYFGEPGGIYDFSVNDPKIAGKKIEQLNASKETIGRHVNPKAMEQLGNQEEQFREVMNKKTIIEEDRSKILSVIDELDVKKEEVIRKAWEKVNQDFNSIFSSLLPTAQAKLKPVDGKSFMDGLEVKVGFGGLWKDSLDELSGGQRSLVALSLILAMLLFKPAPLYILDEVDAALDPSHTQNIGQMLKAHFKQSQFIVVSLKDGMFNNANVLFRTNFVDGMSAVSRTTGGGASR
ncbi:unnamed protein product [Nesidiocoris tenuis]|uniref:Uncharacterized protein n=1 Tax=Nesidiocoris tenuis TaxID=355587 RepID=A0A6H5G2Z7_9HEMI|nr:unnamed protein product [Nesidiocoris tenuis]CAA9996178.1 unnamed protein product [Nesidiocoris tenuis]